MTKENELTIITHRTGQVYLDEGWYTYEELEDIVASNKRVMAQLVKNITTKETK